MSKQDWVPEHDHITVDEETYWGLMYVHNTVLRMFEDGTLTEGIAPGLKYLSDDAESRLGRSRLWNKLEPEHHR